MCLISEENSDQKTLYVFAVYMKNKAYDQKKKNKINRAKH